jgi:hypothetical protein
MNRNQITLAVVAAACLPLGGCSIAERSCWRHHWSDSSSNQECLADARYAAAQTAALNAIYKGRHDLAMLEIARTVSRLPADRGYAYYWSVLATWDRQDGGSRVAGCRAEWRHLDQEYSTEPHPEHPAMWFVGRCVEYADLPS